MATQTNNLGLVGHAAHNAQPYVMSTVVDYATEAPAATDVLEVLNIPAGSLVHCVGADVLTADTAGNSGTIAVGDGSATYIAAATVASTGSMTMANDVGEMFVAYDAANTIDATGATGTINAKIRYWAVVSDFTNPSVTQTATFT
jgi:hypothetical protein